MRREDFFSILILFVIIALLIALAVFAINKVFGKEGVIDQYTEADNEYNKSEIVDKLNLIIKEKYIFDYKYATANNKTVTEVYNEETIIGYLLDENYIEPLKDINDNLVENQYYIQPNSINSDIATSVINENGSESNGTKIFKIKKLENKYSIFFVDKYGEEEEIGELILNPEV